MTGEICRLDVTGLTAPTATDKCGLRVIVTNDTTLPILGEDITTVVNGTCDGGKGNTSTLAKHASIGNFTAPVALVFIIITGQCNATVPVPKAKGGC